MRGLLNKLMSRLLSITGKWQQQQLRHLNIHEYQCRYYLAFAAYLSFNLTFPTTAGSLCAFTAPAAAGLGILEVKAYLNGIDAHSILTTSTLFVKRPPIVCILTRHYFMPGLILGLYPHIKPHK